MCSLIFIIPSFFTGLTPIICTPYPGLRFQTPLATQRDNLPEGGPVWPLRGFVPTSHGRFQDYYPLY